MKLSDAKSGQIVMLDAGFTCASSGPVTLKEDTHGIYFDCQDGHHYIDGQSEDGVLIGITEVKTEE